MHISLTPQLEAFVKAHVDSGMYNNASEVVREALHDMRHQEQMTELELEHLRREVAIGLEEVERGETVDAGEALARIRSRYGL